VVQVLDRGTSDDGEDYIVYEFVDGGDLSDAIAKTLPMEPTRAAALVADIARGLHAAHAAGVIHCDLKPSNVMLTADGRPKIADFGIAVRVGEDRRAELAARAYGRGPVGNIAFISPEQFRNDERGFSVPSDVYALGGLLYHLLTGALPNGSTREEISATHDAATGRRTPPSVRETNASVDQDLDAIVRRSLSVDPVERHSSAAAFAEDLDRWRRSEPIAWRKPSMVRRATLWARRKPSLAMTSMLVLIVGTIGLTVANHYSREADRKAAEAERQTAEAQRKSLEAQIAQAELDRKSAVDAERQRILDALSMRLPTIKDDRRFLTDMLMQVWVYEFVYGPKALGDPLAAKQMWSVRVNAIRNMLTQREASGEGDTLESTLWRYALAFWLVSDHDHAEATPHIERVHAAWSRSLTASDPWLRDLQTLRTCAEVNQTLADGAMPSRLSDLEKRLLHHEEAIRIAYPRSPLHYLVLNRLADVYGDRGLNRPEDVERVRSHIDSLLDNTQNKNVGVAELLSSSRASSQPTRQP
jgi:hypothetical protein